MHKIKPVVAASLLLAATDVLADGWYTSAIIGAITLSDQSLEYSDTNGTAPGNASFETGFMAGAAMGYDFTTNWRIEGEIQYRTSPLDSADITGVGSFSEGDFSSLAFGVNGFYDMNLFGSERARAYVGAGIAWLQEIDIDFETNGVEQSYSSDEIAYQLMLGGRYDINDIWFLSTDIRYLAASDITMTAESAGGDSVTADYDPLTLSAGIGFRF